MVQSIPWSWWQAQGGWGWHTGRANSFSEGRGQSRKDPTFVPAAASLLWKIKTSLRCCLRGTFTRHVEVKFTPPSFQQLWRKPSANVTLGVDVATAAVRLVLRNGYVKRSAQMPNTHGGTLIWNNQGAKLKQIMSATSTLLLQWSLCNHWLIFLYSWCKRQVVTIMSYVWLRMSEPFTSHCPQTCSRESGGSSAMQSTSLLLRSDHPHLIYPGDCSIVVLNQGKVKI